MEAACSNVVGEPAGALFASDPAVLDSATILGVFGPAKMRVAWLQFLADGLGDAASLTSMQLRYERDAVLAGLDYAALAGRLPGDRRRFVPDRSDGWRSGWRRWRTAGRRRACSGW